MRIKIYYNKNLKMSEGKLAAQVGHVCAKVALVEGYEQDATIVVLGLSAKKFYQTFNDMLHTDVRERPCMFIQNDLGLTEVEAGTMTAFGFVEEA